MRLDKLIALLQDRAARHRGDQILIVKDWRSNTRR
jgi:hypothetical protein